MVSWTDDKAAWLMALGGVVAGFIVTKLSSNRHPRANPGEIELEFDGYTVFGRPVGTKKYSMDFYVVCHPDSDAVEHIGKVSQTLSGSYTAYPVNKYRCLGMNSLLPQTMLKDFIVKGIKFKSLNASARYLWDLYLRHKNTAIEIEEIHRKYVKQIVE